MLKQAFAVDQLVRVNCEVDMYGVLAESFSVIFCLVYYAVLSLDACWKVSSILTFHCVQNSF